MGAVQQLCDKHGSVIHRGGVSVHRYQGTMERLSRMFAERLFGFRYQRELAKPGTRSREWNLGLPEVIKAWSNEVTCLTVKKPFLAICMRSVKANPAAPASLA